MKTEKEIKEAQLNIQEQLVDGMSEIDTVRLRGWYAALKWVILDEPKQDGFSEDKKDES